MAIIYVEYDPRIALSALVAGEGFGIDANSRPAPAKEVFDRTFIAGEIRTLLAKPAVPRSFVIGPLTGKIDPETGIMRDEDIRLIEHVHDTLTSLGVAPYSSFRREHYGEVGILDTDATLLDKMAVLTSPVMTVLPGASKSRGTWEEIRFAASLGRTFVFLFDGNNPEKEFQNTLRERIANLSTHPQLIFIMYRSLEDMAEQIQTVWESMPQPEIADDAWNRIVAYAARTLLADGTREYQENISPVVTAELNRLNEARTASNFPVILFDGGVIEDRSNEHPDGAYSVLLCRENNTPGTTTEAFLCTFWPAEMTMDADHLRSFAEITPSLVQTGSVLENFRVERVTAEQLETLITRQQEYYQAHPPRK